MSGKFSLLRAYAWRIKEIFWEWQGVKSAGDAVSAHASTDKKAKVLVSISFFVIFTCLITLQLKGCYDESEIRKSDDNSRAYQSQLSEADSNLREKDSKISSQQADFNEMKREDENEKSKFDQQEELTLAATNSFYIAKISSTNEFYAIQITNLTEQITNITNEIDKAKLTISNFKYPNQRFVLLANWAIQEFYKSHYIDSLQLLQMGSNAVAEYGTSQDHDYFNLVIFPFNAADCFMTNKTTEGLKHFNSIIEEVTVKNGKETPQYLGPEKDNLFLIKSTIDAVTNGVMDKLIDKVNDYEKSNDITN